MVPTANATHHLAHPSGGCNSREAAGKPSGMSVHLHWDGNRYYFEEEWDLKEELDFSKPRAEPQHEGWGSWAVGHGVPVKHNGCITPHNAAHWPAASNARVSSHSFPASAQRDSPEHLAMGLHESMQLMPMHTGYNRALEIAQSAHAHHIRTMAAAYRASPCVLPEGHPDAAAILAALASPSTLGPLTQYQQAVAAALREEHPQHVGMSMFAATSARMLEADAEALLCAAGIPRPSALQAAQLAHAHNNQLTGSTVHKQPWNEYFKAYQRLQELKKRP